VQERYKLAVESREPEPEPQLHEPALALSEAGVDESDTLAEIPEEQIQDAEVGVLEEEPKGTTPYNRHVRLLYLWARQLIIDAGEGRGDITGFDRRLIHLSDMIPELVEIGAKASSKRDSYFRFTDICDPMSKEVGTPSDIEAELLQAVGKDVFKATFKELVKRSKEAPVPPEVTSRLMAAYLGWQSYLESSLLIFSGLVLALKYIGKMSNKTALEFSHPLTVSWVTHMRWEILRGLASKNIEEKTLIQGIFYIGYSVSWGKFTEAEGVEFITACVTRLQWAWIFTRLGAGWLVHNERAALAYRQAFARIFGPSAAFFENAPTEKSVGIQFPPLPTLLIKNPKVQYPYAFFLVDRTSWLSGMNEVPYLKPLRKFSFKSGQTFASFILIFGPRGSGKTAISMSLALLAIWDGMTAVVLKSDSTNQATYMMLPAFEIPEIESFLLTRMGVVPHPAPTMVLNIIRPSQRHLLKAVPFTRWDRIVEVENPDNFDLDWGIVMDALKKVHDEFPMDPKPRGAVVVNRNLQRQIKGLRENEDLKISANLNGCLNRWQEHHRLPIFLLNDEIRDMAPAFIMGGSAGKDTSRMQGQFIQTLIDARRLNYSMTGNTVQPQDIVTAAINMSSDIFFRDLPPDQMDFLLKKGSGAIQLRDDSERDIVYSLNEANALGPHLEFWFNREKREMNLAYLVPPPTHLESTSRDPKLAFQMWEKRTGKDILVDYKDIKWDQVTIAKCRGVSGARRPKAEEESAAPQFPIL
jgi:hypothetical protein